MAVGWLEHPRPYERGKVAPEVVDKLLHLHQGFRDFTGNHFRGLHTCSLCEATGVASHALEGSHVNLFLPGEGEVFLAPGRVDHYVVEHDYKPPNRFLDAVLACPEPGSPEFTRLLRRSNSGNEPPELASFERDGGREYVVLPSLAYSTGVLDSEGARLVEAGFARALSVKGLDAMMLRLAASYLEAAPLRSYAGWVATDEGTVWIRVMARTPFEARAAIRAEVDGIQAMRISDETRPRITHTGFTDRVDVKQVPYSEGVLDVAYWRQLEKEDPHRRGLNTTYCTMLKARMAANYSKDEPCREFLGAIDIGDQRIDFRVAARTGFAAEVAVIAEYGDGHFVQP